jgi:hypothetical protein
MFSKAVAFVVISLLTLLMILASQASYAQDGMVWLEYSTKNNPRTRGNSFTLNYPPSYVLATEFSKDEYLQIFEEYDEEGSGDNYAYLTVNIQNLPNNIKSSALLTGGTWDFQKLDHLWQIIAKEISGVMRMDSAISWGNVPMVKFATSEIKGEITFLSGVLFALHGDKLIKLKCGFNTFGDDPEFARRDLTRTPVCHSYFNSLQFLE